ncbi:MAG: Asp-tRNA(Asn)/Glu-tRNA(Gln) amidotransferase subunit GatC [bacterium]|nr:Asp-tRNA(Asn)/Glu-tRNA(Gln) amidotransferase subunit GatC [bacterium]
MDTDLVRHVALLARLKLSEEEEVRLAGELSAIVGYIDQLNEVDTTDVPGTAHALPVVNVLRADEPVPSPGVEQALANAPQREDHFFRVPKVLDQDSA